MTTTTKFNIGDRVFFMYDNKVAQDTIDHIVVSIRPLGDLNISAKQVITTRYCFTYCSEDREESQVFATKEELLESL